GGRRPVPRLNALVAGRDRTAERRADSEDAKEVRRRRDGADRVGAIGAQPRIAWSRLEKRETCQSRVMRLDLLDVHAIDSPVNLARLRVVRLNQYEAVRIPVGERTEEHPVGERENRGVDANPERQRDDRDKGEAAIAPQ